MEYECMEKDLKIQNTNSEREHREVPPDRKKSIGLPDGWFFTLGGLCSPNYTVKEKNAITKRAEPKWIFHKRMRGQEMDETMTASSENAPVDSSSSGSEISSSTADGSVLDESVAESTFARMETKMYGERRWGKMTQRLPKSW